MSRMERWMRLPYMLRGLLIVVPAALATLNGLVWLGLNRALAAIAAVALGGIAGELVTRHDRRHTLRAARTERNAE
ncbi:hypothetical protein [Streptomyces sp. PH10-H1]|uniref:hypothetical protein n=1 Tax=Streptomyces sp. PH10-H1 TaxID=3046212 RepID=UPI0024B98E83|nr:hypothetical protein [Streptomyces sp. PH10-H1]MDJ0347249.1 hypothetical protein [Streptomyces sp. PH10-H1]